MFLLYKIIQKNKILIFLIILSSFMCLWNLGKNDFVRWDEYTNFRVVKDTVESGNFFFLQYFDSISGRFFEKPPLWYWIGIIFAKIFGISTFSLRFITALSAIALVITIYKYLSTRFNSTIGLISSLGMLATAHFFISYKYIFSTHTFRSADLDILQILFIVITLFFADDYFKQKAKNRKTHLLLCIGVTSSLAFLTKGPFGFFAFFLFILFSAYKAIKLNNFKKFLSEIFLTSLPIICIVGGWHIIMYMKYGEVFWNEYFSYHLLSRYTTSLEGHTGYPLMYINYFLRTDLFYGGILSCLALVYLSIFKRGVVIKNFLVFSSTIGLIIALLMLSFMQTKIAWYIFYVYPLANILVGCFMFYLEKEQEQKIKALFSILALIIISGCIFTILFSIGIIGYLIVLLIVSYQIFQYLKKRDTQVLFILAKQSLILLIALQILQIIISLN